MAHIDNSNIFYTLTRRITNLIDTFEGKQETINSHKDFWFYNGKYFFFSYLIRVTNQEELSILHILYEVQMQLSTTLKSSKALAKWPSCHTMFMLLH